MRYRKKTYIDYYTEDMRNYMMYVVRKEQIMWDEDLNLTADPCKEKMRRGNLVLVYVLQNLYGYILHLILLISTQRLMLTKGKRKEMQGWIQTSTRLQKNDESGVKAPCYRWAQERELQTFWKKYET
jgi:hypothetical protein